MKWNKINESRSELSDERRTELVDNVYDSLKAYIECLVFGGDARRNRTFILRDKDILLRAMDTLEKECGLTK